MVIIILLLTSSSNNAQLYTCLINTSTKPSAPSPSSSPTDLNKSRFLLCCLSMREKGLESFREDLDTFTGTLKPFLMKKVSDEAALTFFNICHYLIGS